jgi:hypothetical protein
VTANQGLRTPEDVAEEIIRYVKKGRSTTVLPKGAFRILYWMSHLLPRSKVALIWGKLFKAQR